MSTEPLNEEQEAPMTEAAVLRKGDVRPITEEYPPDPPLDEYGYPETPNDKAHLMRLVTRGRPFILITLDDQRQAQVDASGFDLVAAYATVSLVAEALSGQIDQH